MTKIIASIDCGNSPRKEFLKDFTIALAKGDLGFVVEAVAEDIQWEIVGRRICTNKEQLLRIIQQQQFWRVRELRVETVVTHGTDASVSGRVITTEGKPFAFCHVVKFKGFKGVVIKNLQTFIIEVKDDLSR